MTVARRHIPETYSYLQASVHQIESRASASLYNYLTANSLFVLAWVTMFVERWAPVEKLIIMAGISIIGVLTGFQWALLGTRTWQYSLEYGDRLRVMWGRYRMSAHADVDATVRAHWDKDLFLISANQWVLFLAPLALSALHAVMLSVALCDIALGRWTVYWTPVLLAVVWVAYALYLWQVCRQCRPILMRGRGALPSASSAGAAAGRERA